MLAHQRIPHALLFEGPEGTGKYLSAKILVQIVFCERLICPTEACGRCDSCHKLQEGQHPDLMELDGEAKNLKVGDIREAEAALRLRPLEAPYKVLLIPDADRMTIQAQNALLKTLEEPPGQAHIILSSSKVPILLPTVLSRCQRVSFLPIAGPDVAKWLQENQQVSKEVAELSAALAQGSLGKASALDFEALFEQRKYVERLDARLSPEAPEALVDALEMGAELAKDKDHLRQHLELLLVWLHDQLRLCTGVRLQELANRDRLSELQRLAQKRGLNEVLARAEATLEARRQLDLPYNLNVQMICEQFCLTLARQSELRRLPA